MAWTQTDLDALDQAIAAGTLEVSSPSGTVRYHSLADMLHLRRVMRKEVLGSTTSETSTTLTKFSKG